MNPIACLCLFTVLGNGDAEIAPRFPAAPREEIADTLHGRQVPDAYRWLETDSAETRAWVRAQDRLLHEFILDQDGREELSEQIDRYHEGRTATMPVRAGGRWFFLRDPEGRQRKVLSMQEGPEGERRVLHDPGEDLLGSAREMQWMVPSPDGRLVAVGMGGTRGSELRLFDVDTREFREDLLEESTGFRSVSWLPDGQSLLYVIDRGLQEPEEGQESGPALYLHRLGTDQADDPRLHHEPNRELSLSARADDEGRWIVAEVLSASGSGSRVLLIATPDRRDPAGGAVIALFSREDARCRFLGSTEDSLFFWTEQEAPKGRVISYSASHPEEGQFEEVVSPFDEASAGGSTVGGNGYGLFGDRFVILYYRDGLPLVRIFGLDGELHHEIEQDVVGTIYRGFRGTRDDPLVFYEVDTAFDPGTIRSLDVHSGQDEVWAPPTNLPYDLFDFEVTHDVVEREDGARIPVLIAHRADQEPEGNAPCWMYGYGAAQWVAFAWRQPWLVSWIEQGGVYVVAGIRGGGEHGREWAEAGAGRRKPVAIDDFNAVAEWLVDRGWSAPRKLVADGWSASGSLAAAAVQRRPDLYGAALIGLPTLDLIRAPHYRFAGEAYEREFGDLDDAKDFAVMMSWSPYHNVQPAEYPATLVWCGELDASTPPLHSYKYVAALQAAQQGPAPICLQLIRGAGHSLGRNQEQTVATTTVQLSFLRKALGMPLDP